MEKFGFDQLTEVVRQIFEKVENIEAMLNAQQQNQPDTTKPLSIEEAATYLDVTKSALYAMTSRRQIVFNKLANALLF